MALNLERGLGMNTVPWNGKMRRWVDIYRPRLSACTDPSDAHNATSLTRRLMWTKIRVSQTRASRMQDAHTAPRLQGRASALLADGTCWASLLLHDLLHKWELVTVCCYIQTAAQSYSTSKTWDSCMKAHDHGTPSSKRSFTLQWTHHFIYVISPASRP